MTQHHFERRGGLGRAAPGAPLWVFLFLLATMPALVPVVGSAAGPPLAATASDSVVVGKEASGEAVAEDSPRASLAGFLELTRARNYARAARYLDLPAEAEAQGAELSRKLKAVLDRHAWVDLSLISSKSEGNVDDGLPAGIDEIARIPGPAGATEPVRLVHHEAGGARWVFTTGTVGRIESWYDRLELHWILENLPAPLLRSGPRDLLYWQWLALPLLLIVSWLLGYLLSRLSRKFLGRIAQRTETRWDDEVLTRVGGPLTLAWALAAASLLLPSLALYQPAEVFVNRILRAGLFVAFFWMLARSVDVARQIVAETVWARERPASRSLLSLGASMGKLVVWAVAVVAMLSEFGYPVASLIAGLGIGGLALALAAQKTMENLFGAFSIGADQPIREGDFVRIEEFVGTVETIGLRSTRFRTLDRTLISIPNGKLAEMRLESLTARDRLRLACTVGLVYGTTATQMREVLAGLERVLREHELIWPEAVVVRFKEFGDSSLNIEIMAWFQTSTWSEFQLIRQDVLLKFMDVVETAGSSFAFPTRTIHLVNEKG